MAPLQTLPLMASPRACPGSKTSPVAPLPTLPRDEQDAPRGPAADNTPHGLAPGIPPDKQNAPCVPIADTAPRGLTPGLVGDEQDQVLPLVASPWDYVGPSKTPLVAALQTLPRAEQDATRGLSTDAAPGRARCPWWPHCRRFPSWTHYGTAPGRANSPVALIQTPGPRRRPPWPHYRRCSATRRTPPVAPLQTLPLVASPRNYLGSSKTSLVAPLQTLPRAKQDTPRGLTTDAAPGRARRPPWPHCRYCP